ncbi:acyl-CoA:lysophosphatidylglycerol acyltransferase 1-like [Lineus longissimus]|uniref:acyl-CoA:lysophosphatidylglycerol acyltransferase 1-like n=1 Tax=Lineus longissimus TaxID=88925 RepID=UPI002B4F2241
MELPKIMIYILRVLFIIVNNFYCIPTYMLWILTFQPLRYLQPSLYWLIEGTMYKWLLTMVGYWGWMCGHRIIEYGDDITKCLDRETLMLVNHQSTCDVPALMYALIDKGSVINDKLWIIDRDFKYSNFGWISQCHRDFFIAQGKKNSRGDQSKQLSDHIVDHYWPLKRKWITLYPEGGFLYKRRARSQRYAQERNLPVLEHVTLPRVGCLHTLLNLLSPNLETRKGPNPELSNSMKPSLKYIIDLTFAYPNGKALNFADFAIGTGRSIDFALHYRVYPANEIPLDNEGLTKWMYDRYVEKEALLDAYYNTGKYPKIPPGHEQNKVLESPRQVLVDERWIFTLHLLFIFSSAVHYAAFRYFFSFIF